MVLVCCGDSHSVVVAAQCCLLHSVVVAETVTVLFVAVVVETVTVLLYRVLPTLVGSGHFWPPPFLATTYFA